MTTAAITREPMPDPVIDRAAVKAFLIKEARFADEHCYDAWEALWADEALYWVPIREDLDPETHVSFIYDNRARIGSRIRQLKTGRRHAQAPQSELRRIVGNVEVSLDGDMIVAESNFILMESRRGAIVTWAGRTIHRLVRVDGDFRITEKKVLLINRGEAINNLAFLI